MMPRMSPQEWMNPTMVTPLNPTKVTPLMVLMTMSTRLTKAQTILQALHLKLATTKGPSRLRTITATTRTKLTKVLKKIFPLTPVSYTHLTLPTNREV